MNIEYDRFKFWIILFTICYILAGIITLLTLPFNFAAMIMTYIFFILLSVCLSIKSIYEKVEKVNGLFNNYFNNLIYKDITVKCMTCGVTISNNKELYEHMARCDEMLNNR